MKYLDANHVWETKRFVLYLLEIIGDGHIATLTKSKCEIGGAMRAELFYDPSRLGSFGTRSVNSYSGNEPLQTQTFPIRESSSRSEKGNVVLFDILETNVEEGA